MKIGVLDIQGSVAEHAKALMKAGAEVVFVKKVEDLGEIRGLVIPGGESTTIGKLLRRFELREPIIDQARGGLPIYGTCAGAILLAKEIVGKETADTLELMDVAVERNSYGRQLDSFETELDFKFVEGMAKVPATFIRAPRILKVGAGVEVLAELDGETVAAQEGNLLISSFHPEMTTDLRVHHHFLAMCRGGN